MTVDSRVPNYSSRTAPSSGSNGGSNGYNVLTIEHVRLDQNFRFDEPPFYVTMAVRVRFHVAGGITPLIFPVRERGVSLYLGGHMLATVSTDNNGRAVLCAYLTPLQGQESLLFVVASDGTEVTHSIALPPSSSALATTNAQTAVRTGSFTLAQAANTQPLRAASPVAPLATGAVSSLILPGLGIIILLFIVYCYRDEIAEWLSPRRRCPQCGNRLAGVTPYCGGCGARLSRL